MISAWTRTCQAHRREKGETLADVLEPSLALGPDRVAIHFEGRDVTYRQLDASANRVANGLLAAGVKRGDRVAIHVDNRPEFIEICVGVHRAGATLVPTNVMYTADEMEHILRDSGARFLFVLSNAVGKIEAISPRLPDLRDVVEVLGQSREGERELRAWQAGQENDRPLREGDPEDIAFIQYTSGTTGKPKGAMVSHRNVLAVLDNTLDLPGGREAGEEEAILLVLPLFHAYALNLVVNRALLGLQRIVLFNRFDASRVLEAIERERVTVFYGAPPMYAAFISSGALERYDISCLRAAFSGAAPLPLVVIEKFKQRSGVTISEGYGLSETAPTLCSNMAGPINKPGSVGPAIPGVEIRIVDDNDRDVPRGDVGEIIARGPNIFKGYFGREQETAEALRGGWFHTGDLGRVDADGYYYIVDRKKDMILVSGYNVYPIEVENVILRHPKVADCAVIGVPSDYQGETVKACVVLEPRQTLELEELAAYCREHLAAFKVPRLLEVCPALPKSATGKVLKRILRP